MMFWWARIKQLEERLEEVEKKSRRWFPALSMEYKSIYFVLLGIGKRKLEFPVGKYGEDLNLVERSFESAFDVESFIKKELKKRKATRKDIYKLEVNELEFEREEFIWKRRG